MKKTLQFLFFSFWVINITTFNLFGAMPRTTIKDIPYRYYEENDTNTYKKSRCVLDINYPTNGKNLPSIIFFYGGGLTQGTKWLPMGGFENQNIIQIAPNYRLSPNVKCPAYIEDAAAAVDWIFKHIKEYGGDPGKIYLSGVSSGGYLANMIYLDKNYLSQYKIDPDSFAGFFSYSSQMTTHFQVCWEEYGKLVNSDTKIIDKYAPLFNARKTIKPIYLFTADSLLDMAGRYEQNIQMTNLLRSYGNNQVYYIQLKGYDHNTFLAPAFSNTIKILNNDIIYLDSIKNLKIYNVITRLNDIGYPKIIYSSKILNIHSIDTIKNIIIYSAIGKILFHTPYNTLCVNIDTHQFKTGTYFVKINTSKKEYVEKLIFN